MVPQLHWTTNEKLALLTANENEDTAPMEVHPELLTYKFQSTAQFMAINGGIIVLLQNKIDSHKNAFTFRDESASFAIV